CTAENSTGVSRVRAPAVAGAFYSSDSVQLARNVRLLLDKAEACSPRIKPAGLISPHAGYVYSGTIAAQGFRQLQGFSYSTVVVIAPSHRERFGFSSVYCAGGYNTPLGTLTVDEELAGKIVSSNSSLVRCGSQGHLQENLTMGEHSLEVQLPFLQAVLGPEVKLVPVVMGRQDPPACAALAKALVRAVGGREDVLLVASSDLSHFHIYDEANRLDSHLAQYVKSYDYRGLMSALGRGEIEACGGGPMAVVMMACERMGARGVRVLARANSGDTAGDRSRVVGYLSAMFYRYGQPAGAGTGNKSSKPGEPMGLSDKEKKYLLELARKYIVYAVTGGDRPPAEAVTPLLARNRGAFVTIKKNGALRGCIGYLEAIKPLVETVSEMAMAAAVKDTRFPPVSPGELDRLELEISVMSPIFEVTDPETIVVGRDGLIIGRGPYRGLLLPQVASEYGWDRETFLAQTCRKAGLPPDAWKQEGTRIEAFSAEVFGERDFH
ncbi:MAG: AmmeMemoRadiSam system protein B, partial [Gemmatimonadota bacterium]|nr:AmmeMemoRadiSam system protein B [Gemmatimonadota bacterium]